MASLLDVFLAPLRFIKKHLPYVDNALPHDPSGEEIALILNTNLFRIMSDDELAKLISSVHITRYKAGEIILQEGESGDALYIITDGTAEVFINDANNKKVKLTVLTPGSYFGEQAIYGEKVKTRNASVEALSDIVLIKIKGKYLSKLLKKDESLKSLIEERKVKQSVNIIAHASIFQKEIESLLSNLTNPHVLEFHHKECIFEVGDRADRVYMVIQGKVKLLIPQDNSDHVSELILNKGHLFGELGVMTRAPRAATAIADGNLRLLGIDGDEFMKDVAISEGFKSMLSRLQKMYALPMRGTVEQYAKYVPGTGNTIMNVYKLNDGRVIHSSKILEQDVFTMLGSPDSAATSYCYYDGDKQLEILVNNEHLIGIKAKGNWETLPDFCYMLLDNVKVEPVDIDRFKKSGKLWAENVSS